MEIILEVAFSFAAGFALCLMSWIIDRGTQDRNCFQPSKFFYGATFALMFAAAGTYFG